MLEGTIHTSSSTTTLPSVDGAWVSEAPSTPPDNRLSIHPLHMTLRIRPGKAIRSSTGHPFQVNATRRFDSDFEMDETASDASGLYREGNVTRSQISSDESIGTSRKRGRSGDRGRTIDVTRRTDVSSYLVKRSKKTPGQQRGLDWLSAAGKAHLDDRHQRYLAQWGVKAGHRGTSVQSPEDWKAMDPEDLMAIFQEYEPPAGGSSRAWYAYSDHATSLARAAAWYGQWPRTGVELDNFLGCGPFQPMDGSHLCHHEHCIVHLTYESAAVNLDRWDCCLEACFPRQDGRDVPEHCTKPSPLCLMQVSE